MMPRLHPADLRIGIEIRTCRGDWVPVAAAPLAYGRCVDVAVALPSGVRALTLPAAAWVETRPAPTQEVARYGC